MFVALLILGGVGIWTAVPLATGAPSSQTQLNLSIPSATAVVPGFSAGDTSIKLGEQVRPGDPKTASSKGWRITTNHPNGYEVRIAATTDPALSGRNAVDNEGARATFADFTVGGCPCPWDAKGTGANRGVFGYSAQITTTSGGAALNTSKWANGTEWRGFTNGAGYQLYSTPGGVGDYSFNLRFRTEIPRGTSQPAGSYRAVILVRVAPLI